jgi:hypothetical protein
MEWKQETAGLQLYQRTGSTLQELAIRNPPERLTLGEALETDWQSVFLPSCFGLSLAWHFN